MLSSQNKKIEAQRIVFFLFNVQNYAAMVKPRNQEKPAFKSRSG